jgi:hypothetical protein
MGGHARHDGRLVRDPPDRARAGTTPAVLPPRERHQRRTRQARASPAGYRSDHGYVQALGTVFSERDYQRVRELGREHQQNYPRRIAT